MKKALKIISLVLAFVLAIAATAAITVAILTDEESAVNVMTVGNVYIDQMEYERGGNGQLQDFTQNKPWMPVTVKPVQPSATATTWEAIGAPGSDYLMDSTVEGIQDKFVFVKNTGTADAYVRTLIAYECPEGFNRDLLHINDNEDLIASEFYTNISGVRYLVREYVYPQALTPGEISRPSLLQVWLDFDATNADAELYAGQMDVLVVSQAVQADGFGSATALDALNAAFDVANPTNVTTWFEKMLAEKNTITATTPEELLEAFENAQPGNVIDGNGLTVVLDDGSNFNIPGGITLKNVMFESESRGGEYIVITPGVGDTITFENCTIQREELSMMVIAAENEEAPNMVFNACTFNGPVAPNFVAKADGSAQFNNCTFGVGKAFMKQGWVNAMGGTHTFTGCTFDYTGGSTNGSNQYVRYNAVNSYSEPGYSTAVELIGCTFINCGNQKYGANSTLVIK